MAHFFSKENRDKRIAEFTGASVWLNAFIALSKIGMGILSASIFVCVAGLYNVGMAVAKVYALRGRREAVKLKNFRMTGLVITLTTVIYGLYSVLMVVFNLGSASTYGFAIDIIVIAVTFLEIILAVVGIVVARIRECMSNEAIKYTNLVGALVSLVLAVGILLTLTSSNDVPRLTGIVGCVIGFVASFIGLHMMWRGHRLELLSLGKYLNF